MTINLSDNTPRVSYTVAQGVTQTSFTVSFEFFADADLNVYVDNVLKTITTDYTVSGGSGSTGTVTMSVTGATGGSTVVITRDIALERTTDFPASGAFQIGSLNTELDKITAQFADRKDAVDRSLRLQDSDAAGSMELPLKATRAGTVLGFNATTGVPEAGPKIADVSTLSTVTADIATLADIEDGTDATDAIQTVAGIASNVTTVAGVSANVTTVAGVTSNMQSIVDNLSDVQNAATNATTATTKASEAASSATAAASSASSASSSATAAQTAQTAAETAETNAETAETNAETAETNAASSATAAASSATTASGHATTATTKASEAATSATNASTSASTATTKASEASTSASAAATSAAAAEAAFDAFDDIYLGAKSSAPTVDNDGDALTAGDQYFNTTNNTLFVWNGSAWQAASPDLVGDTTPQLGGNLDLNSNDITGTGNINNTGTITTDGLTVDGDVTLNDGSPNLRLQDSDVNRYVDFLYGTRVATFRNTMASGEDIDVVEPSIVFSFKDDGETRTAMTIDHDGRVAVGTTTPHTADSLLTLQNSSGVAELNITSGTSGATVINMGDTGDYNIGRIKYDQSDNSMQFNTQNAEAMRISSTGNVGIGNSSPDSYYSNSNQLVVGSGAARQGITIASSTSTIGQLAFADGTSGDARYEGWVIYDHNTDHMSLGTSAEERLRIDSSGNVGIGSANPEALLHVEGASTGQMMFRTSASSVNKWLIGKNSSADFSIGEDGNEWLYVERDSGNVGIGGTIDNHGGYARVLQITGAGESAIELENSSGYGYWAMNGTSMQLKNVANGNMLFYTNNTERLRIDSSGNVGIGTSSPTSNRILDANGQVRFQSSSSGRYFDFINDSAASYLDVSHSLNIRTNGASSLATAMTLDTSGNVLVGTATVNPADANDASGAQISQAGTIQASASVSTPAIFNRGSDGAAVAFLRSGSLVGSISITTTSTAYNTSSDYRLKENVTYDWDATTRLKQLKPARFNFIADADTTVDGFLAHEAQTVVPEAVTGTHNEVDGDGNPVMQGIDQSKLVPLLVKTIQELEARITALEAN